MKVLLIAVNAKYIHSNLAVYSLKAYADLHGEKAEYLEYTINHQEEDILAGIYRQKPDVAAFSCYIWNIALIDRIAEELKKVLPGCRIWYGGPEVSYNPKEQLEKKPYVEGIMIGEGEATFLELLRFWRVQEFERDFQIENLRQIAGIAIRTPEIEVTNPRPPLNMDELPFPYEDLSMLEHRIVYYESSRGCPYSCSYCLSSIEKGIRLRSMELVEKELQFLIEKEVPQVKFIDRTFNCNHAHAMAIWHFISQHDRGKTNFHFEISADLLNQEELDLLATFRKGLVQLEIGVQSIHEETIQTIHRKMDLHRLKWAVQKVGAGKNIHQHLDLIAGLPYENFEQFQKSFNYVYALQPEQLQLGFLKVLKGSRMEAESSQYGIVYQSRPPFEVMQTKWLSFDEVLRLKQVEEMVEVYYNSGQFSMILGFLMHYYDTPFQFYEKLAFFYEKKDYDKVNHKRIARYEILLAFISENQPELKELAIELLCCDLYLRENMKSRPSFLPDQSDRKKELREILENEVRNPRFLEGYEGVNAAQLSRMIHAEWFNFDLREAVASGKRKQKGHWVFFDYQKREPFFNQAEMIEYG